MDLVSRDGDTVVLRISVFNDSTSPVVIDRSCLAGPNGVVEGEQPWPVSLEPPAKDPAQNAVLLNPSCFFGRERTFTVSKATTFHAYLVKPPGGGLLPNGPADTKRLVAAAAPLHVAPGQ